MCMTSRGAAGCLWSQEATFNEEGIHDKCLNNGGNYVESSLRYGESDKNNIF
jgi:hypothetical protein